MHGRPRKALKQEDEAALSAKTQKLRSLQAHFLANHHNRMLLLPPSTLSLSFSFSSPSINSNCANLVGCRYSKEALDVSAKLLEINPECYTAWNYRKLAVQHLLSNSDSDPHSIFQDELKLVRVHSQLIWFNYLDK